MAVIPRTLPDGRTVYDVEVRVENRNQEGRKRKITRRAPTYQAALKLETKLKNQADQGAVPDAKMTVGALLDSWVAMHSVGENAWSTYTRYGYQRIVERELRPAFGGKRLDKLTGKDLDDLYARMKARGCSSGTVLNTHSCIRAALNQARKWKLVATNVALDATPGPVYRQEGAVATDAEVDALMAAIARLEAGGDGSREPCLVEGCEQERYGRGFCAMHWAQWRYRKQHQDLALPARRGGRPRALRKDGVLRIKLGLLIAAETGMRRGELAGIDWADFDWRNNAVTVRRAKAQAGGKVVDQTTKTHATRTIPLAADVVAVLKQHRGIGSVCAMSPRQLSDWWDYLCEQAGIEPLPEVGDGRKRRQKKIGWHSLRHRLLTELGGVTDIKTVAAIAGHSTTRVTERYMHEKQERKVAAIQALADRRR